jgi:hypothetical protein
VLIVNVIQMKVFSNKTDIFIDTDNLVLIFGLDFDVLLSNRLEKTNLLESFLETAN